ncbi:hypothetical protein [Paenibacillus sp. HJGM_3]|uniref:hypothetical protein n=1 Tax=Paenibacillus sp. HJGM_3 TaxID=3379816 RepID=UPI00385D5382
MSAGTKVILEGDWVSGASVEDERFIGFVDSVSAGSGLVKVWVTQSDRAEGVGDLVEASLAKVKKLPDQEASAPDELQGLIELALQTHDRAWFEELTTRLNAQKASTPGPAAGGPKRRGTNRVYRLID